jgi:hypothetical protein
MQDNKGIFPASANLEHKGKEESVHPLMKPSVKLNSQVKAGGIKAKPQSERKLPRLVHQGKISKGENALLGRIEEALLDPEATWVSLQSMLSEWGESAIGVDDTLVRHVTYFLKCFALCEREGTSEALERSRKYLPQIRKVFAKYGLPEDLAFALPFVESRFTERALSSEGALGMFQFLAPTASEYGVTVTWDPPIGAIPSTDERLDWKRTSVAAARFLSDHRKMFNSILLALGSYHHGAGTISKVVEAVSGKEKSFRSLFTCNKLQAHSREYIPLCLAAAYLHRLVKGTNSMRIPDLKVQYVSIKKPTPLRKLSTRHKDLKTNNPDLAFADKLYCYASTGGYLLITDLNSSEPKQASSRPRPIMIAQRNF